MLRSNIFIKAGHTDMRCGIDGLAGVVEDEGLNVFDRYSMYIFCGRKKDRFKIIYWSNEGFTLIYKRFEIGKLKWPLSEDGFIQITHQQYRWLLEGLSIFQPKAVRAVDPALLQN